MQRHAEFEVYNVAGTVLQCSGEYDSTEDFGDGTFGLYAFDANETFSQTTITPTYDDNGNLTFDGTYKYTYDAWNRLVKTTLNDTDVTIQTANFDGLGRRIKGEEKGKKRGREEKGPSLIMR